MNNLILELRDALCCSHFYDHFDWELARNPDMTANQIDDFIFVYASHSIYIKCHKIIIKWIRQN